MAGKAVEEAVVAKVAVHKAAAEKVTVDKAAAMKAAEEDVVKEVADAVVMKTTSRGCSGEEYRGIGGVWIRLLSWPSGGIQEDGYDEPLHSSFQAVLQHMESPVRRATM
jgi:hypothetical protein